MKAKSTSEYLRVWDSSNISESFPGIVMPLTFSIARRGYELVYKSQGYAAGLDWYQIEANHRTFNAMIGIFAGRMYYNLYNWYKFIGLFPNNSQNQKYLDEQLQTIGEVVYQAPQHYSKTYRIKFWFRVLKRALFFEYERKNYWRYLETSFSKYEELPQDKKLHNLLERYAYLEQLVIPHMGRAADNDFFVMTYNGLIKKKIRQCLGESAEQQHDFLGALHDVISARQAILLMNLARTIKLDTRSLKLLQQSKYVELDRYLMKTAASSILEEYRKKFLHRFAEDQKIEAINLLNKIDGFYALIKTYSQLNEDEVAERQLAAQKNERERTKKIHDELGPMMKIIYGFLLRRLKHHLRIREHNRLLRGKVYALLRELFVELGEVMYKQKLISDPRDVYYLDIEELFQILDGSGYDDNLKEIIEKRKTKYEEYKKIKTPTRFATIGAITKLPEGFVINAKERHIMSTVTLEGSIASPGIVEGRVMVLNEPIVPTEPFDILVVNHTDPGWTPLIALSKGLIVEHGGILSHAAIVTRELGIPSIIGVEGATSKLRTGQNVRLDATNGTIVQL